MDTKQFERLQSAIQWVADEERLREQGLAGGALRHNQGEWAMGTATDREVGVEWYEGRQYVAMCATACCVAGNVVIANGDTIISTPESASTHQCLTSDGDLTSISRRAEELLGIDDGEAHALFHGSNRPADLYRIGTNLAAEYGHTLEIL